MMTVLIFDLASALAAGPRLQVMVFRVISQVVAKPKKR
jgi:hypothetical protein